MFAFGTAPQAASLFVLDIIYLIGPYQSKSQVGLKTLPSIPRAQTARAHPDTPYRHKDVFNSRNATETIAIPTVMESRGNIVCTQKNKGSTFSANPLFANGRGDWIRTSDH
jgi:hypothetical protein